MASIDSIFGKNIETKVAFSSFFNYRQNRQTVNALQPALHYAPPLFFLCGRPCVVCGLLVGSIGTSSTKEKYYDLYRTSSKKSFTAVKMITSPDKIARNFCGTFH